MITRQEVFWPSLCVVVITAVGAWLRFHDLALESLWFDEAASWYQSKDSVADLIARTANDNYPPLHNFLLYFSIRLFGDGEWSLRLSSAILGTANILLLYWLGSITVGRSAGLVAAAFLAFSGYHIDYSQEARTYTLLAFTATWFAASSFYFFQSPNIARGVLVCLSGLSLLYTHPFGALNWIAIVIAFSACVILRAETTRQTIKIWVASNALAVVAFAPWGWLILARAAKIHHHGFWISYPTTEFVLKQLQTLTSGRSLATLLLVGAMLAVLPSREVQDLEKPKPACSPIPVFIVWAVLPVGIGLLASLISTPIFYHRYLIGALPPLCLAAAYGLTRFARGWPGLAIVFAVSLAILFANHMSYNKRHKQDWRGIAALLEKQLKPSDCVLIYKLFKEMPLGYYYRRKIDCEILYWNVEGLDVKGIRGSRVFAIAPKKDLLATLSSGGWSLQKKFKFHRVNVVVLVRPDRIVIP